MNIRPLATADRKKKSNLIKFRHVQTCLEKDFFFGENMILPSCKIQYTKTSRKNSKMKKIQKTGFFKESALGFCPPRSKKIILPILSETFFHLKRPFICQKGQKTPKKALCPIYQAHDLPSEITTKKQKQI